MDEQDLVDFDEIYGTPCPDIPKGYECAGEFREPEIKEYYLSTDKRTAIQHHYGWKTPVKRLILTKLPEPPPPPPPPKPEPKKPEPKEQQKQQEQEKDTEQEAEDALKEFYKYAKERMKEAKPSKKGKGEDKQEAIPIPIPVPASEKGIGKCKKCGLDVKIVGEGKAANDYRHCDQHDTSMFACHYPALDFYDTDLTPYIDFYEQEKK